MAAIVRRAARSRRTLAPHCYSSALPHLRPRPLSLRPIPESPQRTAPKSPSESARHGFCEYTAPECDYTAAEAISKFGSQLDT
eukprot:1471948-Pleurochrysis_carterae.AAC.1